MRARRRHRVRSRDRNYLVMPSNAVPPLYRRLPPREALETGPKNASDAAQTSLALLSFVFAGRARREVAAASRPYLDRC